MFSDSLLYMEHPKESTTERGKKQTNKKTLELKTKFTKVAGYKTNVQNSSVEFPSWLSG